SPSLSPQGGIPFAGQKGGAVPSCCLLRNKISKRKAFFTHFYVVHPLIVNLLTKQKKRATFSCPEAIQQHNHDVS
ncbi:MAG TPA: hypothetical protein VJC18_06785, partial [bacterium]|nr:hypothetical protein [bacterium]